MAICPCTVNALEFRLMLDTDQRLTEQYGLQNEAKCVEAEILKL